MPMAVVPMGGRLAGPGLRRLMGEVRWVPVAVMPVPMAVVPVPVAVMVTAVVMAGLPPPSGRRWCWLAVGLRWPVVRTGAGETLVRRWPGWILA